MQLDIKMYAGVVVDEVHPSLDKLFHYSIPEELSDKAVLGMRVQVPFGGRTMQGYILCLDDSTEVPVDKIKPIKRILDPAPVLNSSIIPLISWMKSEYHCMYIEAIRCFIPPGLRMNIRGRTQKIACLEDCDCIEDWIRSVEGRSPKWEPFSGRLNRKSVCRSMSCSV